MAGGKQWMTCNLDLNVAPSYCYADKESNCRQYGRLYTWESAQRACKSLGDGWRLPTDDDWRSSTVASAQIQMTKAKPPTKRS